MEWIFDNWVTAAQYTFENFFEDNYEFLLWDGFSAMFNGALLSKDIFMFDTCIIASQYWIIQKHRWVK